MIAKYDRDVLWPWGKFKRVPLSCIPLDYLAWFVQTGTDRIWLTLIERELLCRRDGDKAQHSRTRYATEAQQQEVLKNNMLRQQAVKDWVARPKTKHEIKTIKKQKKIKQRANTRKQQVITKQAHNTNTGSYTTPTYNFDGTPIDFNTPPF